MQIDLSLSSKQYYAINHSFFLHESPCKASFDKTLFKEAFLFLENTEVCKIISTRFTVLRRYIQVCYAISSAVMEVKKTMSAISTYSISYFHCLQLLT